MKATEKTSAANSSTILDKISSKILGLSARVEQVKGRKLEIFVLALYCVLHCVMGIFHEPWFDEAQAWNIARDASLSEVLFEVPHYEGHPALWHLILMPFAKLGLPYEMSLCFVSLVFAGLAVYFLLFKSPFPRIVKITLPFTYFMFYQYGVISRPYCIMVLASCLLAMSYANRNEKPGRYVWCLVLMCMTSAYGIVISGGLAIVWVVEIVREKVSIRNVGGLFRDKRCYMLLALLGYALFILVRIIPKDTCVEPDNGLNGLAVRLVYNFFAMISDVFLTSSFSEYISLRKIEFDTMELASACIIGLLILALISWYAYKKKTLHLFWIPYGFFCIFGSVVYMYIHHTGIAWCLVLFWMWLTLAKNRDSEIIYGPVETKIKAEVPLVMTIAIIVPIFWSVSASIADINYAYVPAREICEVLEEKGLQDKTVLLKWTEDEDSDGNLVNIDMKRSWLSVQVSPYEVLTNVMNWPYEEALFPYYHKIVTDKENAEIKASMIAKGAPDIIIGDPDIEYVYGDTVSLDDYEIIYRIESGLIWKTSQPRGVYNVYLRKE